MKCRPLLSDCPPGEGCYAVRHSFACAPDASDDAGAFGDPCEFVNACDPGSVCVNPDDVSECAERAAGCCTPFCDVNNPSCPGATSCQPWSDDRITLPPGGENLGLCLD